MENNAILCVYNSTYSSDYQKLITRMKDYVEIKVEYSDQLNENKRFREALFKSHFSNLMFVKTFEEIPVVTACKYAGIEDFCYGV